MTVASSNSGVVHHLVQWIKPRARILAPLFTLIVLAVFFGMVTDHFLTLRNLENIVEQASLLAILATGVTMVLLLVRALLGPTVYDRILALNSFGTKTVLIIAAYGFLTERPDFLDIALVYALINFVGTVAVLKYFEYGDLAVSAAGVRRGNTER